MTTSGIRLPKPVPITGKSGDIVLAHYQLAPRGVAEPLGRHPLHVLVLTTHEAQAGATESVGRLALRHAEGGRTFGNAKERFAMKRAETATIAGRRARYLALLRRKLKLASCPAEVVAFAWQPMHVPPWLY